MHYFDKNMKLSDLTINQEGIDWQKCLQHWAWLLREMPEFNVWIVTRFAEIFVVSKDGEIWFLSTANATFKKIAHSKEEFAAFIDDRLDHYFMPDVIRQLENSGMRLNNKECYGFHLPLIFVEATLDADNFKIAQVETYLTGLGDLLGRLQNIQDGERVTFEVKW